MYIYIRTVGAATDVPEFPAAESGQLCDGTAGASVQS